MNREENEQAARAAVTEGFCPDCQVPMLPATKLCRLCRGHWAVNDLGELQVAELSPRGDRFTRFEYFRQGKRVFFAGLEVIIQT